MTDSGGDGGSSFIEQARRRQIVAAAIETLARHGYRGATFARIAEHAGISPSLISYHFSTKAELMKQVVADIVGDLETELEGRMVDSSTYRHALRRMIETEVRYFAEHTSAVLALGVLSHSGDEVVSGLLVDQREASLRDLEQMFADGQRDGELAPFPTRPMAVTLLAALAAVPDELFAAPETDAGAYGRALADLFDAAVRRPDASS